MEKAPIASACVATVLSCAHSARKNGKGSTTIWSRTTNWNEDHRVNELREQAEDVGVSAESAQQGSTLTDIIKRFELWLQSYPGRKHCEKDAHAHGRNVQRILEDLSLGHFTLGVLLLLGKIGEAGGLVDR